MIKRIFLKFGYVILSKEYYDELVFRGEDIVNTEKYKKQWRKSRIDEYARELFLKRVQDVCEADLYSQCRKIAEHLFEMENIDYDKDHVVNIF